jgi:hypothetical protein
MALKRSASKFGLARSLYEKEDKPKQINTSKPNHPNWEATRSREISHEQWLQLKDK